MLVKFCGLEFDLPNDWEDVTDGDDSPPALARPDGVGAVQFSFASRTDGAQITIDDLQSQFAEFGEDTGRLFEHQTESCGELALLEASPLPTMNYSHYGFLRMDRISCLSRIVAFTRAIRRQCWSSEMPSKSSRL